MRYYTIETLETLYRQEFPELSEEIVHSRAKALHTQLNTLDMHWRRRNRRFYNSVWLYGNTYREHM